MVYEAPRVIPPSGQINDGLRLAALRRHQGLRLSEVARSVTIYSPRGYDRGSFSNVERGKVNLSPQAFDEFCRVLGTTPANLRAIPDQEIASWLQENHPRRRVRIGTQLVPVSPNLPRGTYGLARMILDRLEGLTGAVADLQGRMGIIESKIDDLANTPFEITINAARHPRP